MSTAPTTDVLRAVYPRGHWGLVWQDMIDLANRRLTYEANRPKFMLCAAPMLHGIEPL